MLGREDSFAAVSVALALLQEHRVERLNPPALNSKSPSREQPNLRYLAPS